jgi:hypothetical protein
MNKSAPELACLNNGGVTLVEKWLKVMISQFSNENGGMKPRILDIGCGTSPYLEKLPEIDYDCCDKEDYSTKNRGRFTHVAFPCSELALLEGSQPYDIVILSAVAHELHRQRMLSRIRPSLDCAEDINTETNKWLFSSLAKSGLIRPGSHLFVAELYHRKFWPREILVQSQKWQFERYGHADPPCVFPSPAQVISTGDKCGFKLKTLDEGYSLDAGMRGDAAFWEQNKEVALQFINRRFFCLIFEYHPERKMVFRSPFTVVAPTRDQSTYLDSSTREFEKSLGEWSEGKAPDIARRYDHILAGFTRGAIGVQPGVIENASVFPELAKAMFQTSTDTLDYLRVSRSRFHSLWLSLESKVLSSENAGVKSRYLPANEKGEHCALQTTDDPARSCKWTSTEEWSAIGYNHLGSVAAIRSSLAALPRLGRARFPSLFWWFSPEGRTPPLDPDRPESLTLLSGWDCWTSGAACDELIEFGANAASLVRWLDPEQQIARQHVFVVLDAAATAVTDSSRKMNYPVGPGKHLNQLTSGGYCGPLGEFSTHVMESVASVYLDFQFLGSCLNRVPRDPAGDARENVLHAIDSFRAKWLDEVNTTFIADETDLVLTKSNWDEASTKALLPDRYRDYISAACDAAQSYVAQHGSDLLPFSWTIFSTVDAHYQGRDVPGNIMLFADTVLPASVLTQHLRMADECFRTLHWAEEEAIAVRHARQAGRESQLIDMLSSFGHDAKRWAVTIGGILETGWPSAASVAAMFGRSLEARLASYSRFSGATHPAEHISRALADELTTARKAARAVPNELYLIGIRALFVGEVLPIFARICVDESEWRRLADALLGDSEQRRRECFEAVFSVSHGNVLISNEFFSRLRKSNITLEFSGPDLQVPARLKATDGRPTTPLLSTCLRFIFSELLTNVVKHQWSKLDPEEISISFDVSLKGPMVVMSLTTSPATVPKTAFEIPEKNLVGLTSLRLALRTIGGEADEQEIIIDSISRGSFPFPSFNDGSLKTVLRIPKVAFANE